MKIYIGIDPSMNSTGICVQYYESNDLIKDQYYIIKSSKLTKKEKKAEEELLNFDYLVFERIDLKQYDNDNHLHEYYKTQNMIKVIYEIKELLFRIIESYPTAEVYVVQEGISYGSTLKTKSVFDLAGLNYMIRLALNKIDITNYIIATPSEIKKFATGNGNCKKDTMIGLFETIHPSFSIIPKIDDISDAYFMSSYAKYINDTKNNI